MCTTVQMQYIYIAKILIWTLDHHESEGAYLFLSKSYSLRRFFVLNSLHLNSDTDRQSTKNKKKNKKLVTVNDSMEFEGDFFCF